MAGHSVEAVGDGNDASTEWDLSPFQLVGISGPIPSLVMMTDDVYARRKPG
jgi:hypothetical protein